MDRRQKERKQKKEAKRRLQEMKRRFADPYGEVDPVLEEAMRQVLSVMREAFPLPSDLTDQALEAEAVGDFSSAVALAKEAVEKDPASIEAQLLLVRRGDFTEEEAIAELRRIVKLGEEGLEAEYFQEHEGRFWGLIETRPYMSALEALASMLAASGDADESISIWERMLRLNPGDNQGVRYRLVAKYLQSGRLDGARRILELYDEPSAVMAWSKLLERLIVGDEEGAVAALKQARRVNKHVERFLTGRKPVPTEPIEFYGPGDQDEAISCIHATARAWAAHPQALEWLLKRNAKALRLS